jgi:hypothetical protein
MFVRSKVNPLRFTPTFGKWGGGYIVPNGISTGLKQTAHYALIKYNYFMHPITFKRSLKLL